MAAEEVGVVARDERGLIHAALAHLQIDRLLLTVHDASFPAGPGEDIGRGSPYSRAAAHFYAFVAARGFGGVQFGPQGKTSLVNSSPYDGAVMARSHLSLALRPLVDEPGLQGLLAPEQLAQAVGLAPPGADQRACHVHAWHAASAALRAAHRRFLGNPRGFPALADALADFVATQGDWLRGDSLFEVLTAVHGTDDVGQWPALDQRLWCRPEARDGGVADGLAARRRDQLLREHADIAALNLFTQLLLQVQHDRMRARLRQLGLRASADLQVGMGPRDRWQHEPLFLPGYAIGAPPSRTTPLGQAWGYPVLDPAQLAGAAGRFFERRLQRLLDDFDGIRIDHPHGIVCPWVYRTGTGVVGGVPTSTGAALLAGARLFDSPNLPDHPGLARFAIAGVEDLAPPLAGHPRHADDWVRRLSEAQIDRYAVLVDRVMEGARVHGIAHADVCAEVLSTCPYPLAQVMRRHGLGRLRVTQKANPDDPADPYRSATAAPADWITLGTHDTRPIATVVDHWHRVGQAGPWARYLGDRLAPREADRAAWAARLASDPAQMVGALAADLFVGPARHVSLFFSDLFGLRDSYNVPGTIDPHNWTLRVPADFATRLPRGRHRAEGREGGPTSALDLPAAVATALRARARGAAGELADLAAALEDLG